MDVLVIGWSDIVRRRVLPALASLDAIGGLHGVDRVHVATEAEAVIDGLPDGAGLPGRTGMAFTGPGSWQRALTDIPPGLAYVSGTNTAHAPRVLAAVRAGWDVVVDKPAFLDPADRDACVAAARVHDRLLAEATVWGFHDQVRATLDRIRAAGLAVQDLRAVFTVPALPDTNFRTDAALGGGAVADLGAYAMSPARVFGSGRLEHIAGHVTRRSASGLDTAFTVDAAYSDGLRLQGEFSLDAEYANRLAVAGPGWSATLEPAFSSRPDASLTVRMSVAGGDCSFTVPPCDPFATFLAEVLADVAGGERDRQTDRTQQSSTDLLLLADALGIDWPRGTGVH